MIVILNLCYLRALVVQRVYNAAHCIEVSLPMLCSSYTLSLFYYQELGMLSNQVVTSEEIPSPYVSLPRLTALVRYSKICLGAVFFEPSLKCLPDGLDHSCSWVDLSFLTFDIFVMSSQLWIFQFLSIYI